ncbi:alpha/beta hydrolase family protein [Novosphingobium sp.]|uniref:alpha/beta hydrolase family protein n=1 Tax=Novosphingobium sp. TaxID=1874826 RepID=UPI0038B7CD06
MRKAILSLALVATLTAPAAALARAPAPAKRTAIPAAIFTDPPQDKAHPARMETLHIPTGGVAVNGVAYLAVGAGPHPTVVIAHGLPGIEKNLDLAQALRRAGWNTITFNYRGSWGSPGSYKFAQNPEDLSAVLAFLRDPTNAAKLGVDTRHLAVIGHSMGGWTTAMVGAQDKQLSGLVLISAANMGLIGAMPHDALLRFMSENMETLASTPATLTDELVANSAANNWLARADGLKDTPLLVLTSDDGLAGQGEALVAAVRKAGGTKVVTAHEATDHSWSDRRIALEARIIRFLQPLFK